MFSDPGTENINCNGRGAQNIKFKVEINDIIYTILNNIGNKTTREIFDITRKELNIYMDNNELLKIFLPVYEKFQLYNLILLKSSL